MRGLGKRQRHRAKPETCFLLPWKTRARCQGQSWEWQPLPSEAAWISIFPCRVSVSNSSERERIPAGEIPADNLLIPQPNLKVTTQKKKNPLPCGFQLPLFPFQAQSTSLASLYEKGLAVPIETSSNIWFNIAKVLPQLDFAFLALSWELFVEPGALGDTNCVVSSSKLL